MSMFLTSLESPISLRLCDIDANHDWHEYLTVMHEAQAMLSYEASL